DIDDDAIRRRAGLGRDPDALEIAEILQPALSPVDQRVVIRIALIEVEFAADHIVARARIAGDVDAFDIDARALLHRKNQIDAARTEVTITARMNLGEGVAALGQLHGDELDRLLDQLGVIDVAGLGANVTAQHR